ncbi:hypothetical protein R5R35_002093 [Gryllus longicercus]|uniref:Uncharacterized protein n=1 Tax=Gryllus longicercus TaxID=2509291 RepID=A0AAN9VIZ5_9ORTH
MLPRASHTGKCPMRQCDVASCSPTERRPPLTPASVVPPLGQEHQTSDRRVAAVAAKAARGDGAIAMAAATRVHRTPTPRAAPLHPPRPASPRRAAPRAACRSRSRFRRSSTLHLWGKLECLKKRSALDFRQITHNYEISIAAVAKGYRKRFSQNMATVQELPINDQTLISVSKHVLNVFE